MNNIGNILTDSNLIGKADFKLFLEIQALYGYTQRGGAKIPTDISQHSKRLVADINFLDRAELKKIIFGKILFYN